jgi:glycopeptide antibiotics resistance protein
MNVDFGPAPYADSFFFLPFGVTFTLLIIDLSFSRLPMLQTVKYLVASILSFLAFETWQLLLGSWMMIPNGTSGGEGKVS